MTLIFLFVIALLVLSSVDEKAKAENTLSEVDMKLKLLNKPAIKSIKVYFLLQFPYPLILRSIDNPKFSDDLIK